MRGRVDPEREAGDFAPDEKRNFLSIDHIICITLILWRGQVISEPKYTKEGKSAGTFAEPRPVSCARHLLWMPKAEEGKSRWISGIQTESVKTKKAVLSLRQSDSEKSM